MDGSLFFLLWSLEQGAWLLRKSSLPWIIEGYPVVYFMGLLTIPADGLCLTNVECRPAGILLPPHLYGELAKTERGCELLRKHGDLNNLFHIARNSGAAADERKGALWAVVSD